jgi:single-strand DNA-binding protein
MSAYAQISGRLGSEPELRFTNSGTPVINLSIANNRSVKVGEERQSIADWFKVTVFGRDAEVITQYAKKGSPLAFNGRLQNEKYVDRDGVSRTSTILVASSFEFVPTAKRDSANTGESVANGIQAETVAGNEPEEEIPF